MHFGGAMFFTDYSMSGMGLARLRFSIPLLLKPCQLVDECTIYLKQPTTALSEADRVVLSAGQSDRPSC
jgi:hypothetical protein